MSDIAPEPAPPEPDDFITSVDTRVSTDGKALSLVLVNGKGERLVAHFDPESAGRLGGILMANAIEAQKRAGKK